MQKPLPDYRPHMFAILLILALMSLATALSVFGESRYGTVMAEGDNIIISSRWGKMEHVKMTTDFFGQTVMVWQDSGGKSYEVYGQIFDDTGRPKSTTFRVNKYRPYDQKHPAIATDEAGNFVVVYQSYMQDGSEAGIFGQRYSYSGDIKNGVFKVNTYIIGNQGDPAIAMNADGKFVVVWVSEQQDDTPRSIYAQLFDENGKKFSNEFRVNIQNTGSQDSPAVAMDSSGNFMIVWESKTKDTTDVYGQIFDWNGNAKSKNDIRLNTNMELSQTNPSVTLTGKSTFMTVWENETYDSKMDINLENIKGQMFDKSGKKVGGEISVTSPFFGHQENPEIMKTSPSKMLVTWQEYSKKTDYKNWVTKAQELSNTPSKSGDIIILGAYSEGYEKTDPVVASDGRGETSVAWLSKEKSTGMTSIEYERGL
jgi:hypothetical protein